MKLNKRIVYLDLIRIFAIVFIILMHSPIPQEGNQSIILGGISFITAPGLGLLFMVSGALLLPVKASMYAFYKKRLGKVVAPTLFFSFFYIFVNIFIGNEDLTNICRYIISIPFSPQGHGILWFMYTIIGLYLISPIISPWLEKASQKEIETVLLLWMITMCYPFLRLIFQIDDGKASILYYFNGYGGYYLLGYYLHHYHKHIKIKWIALFFFIPLLVAGLIKAFKVSVDFYDLFWYLSIFTAMMSVGWFYVFRIISSKYHLRDTAIRNIAIISDSCFGIYLVHIFIMRQCLWKVPFIVQSHPLLQVTLITLLTFFISFFIVQIIRGLPFSKYIIGIGKH